MNNNLQMKFSVNKLVRPNILAMTPYSSARDEFSDSKQPMVYLDANENPFGDGLNRYPDPHQEALKLVLSKERKCSVHEILLGNGSDEILDLIFRAFCEPATDAVITLPPTYGMYDVLANLNDVTNIKVPLTHEFMPDVDAILSSVKETTKVIFLCSPNNPTGNSFSGEKIEELLLQFKGLVVIDEAYIDFSSSKSWLGRINEFPNLIITQTFSKAYGMAGVRLGMCFASEEIITILKRIKPPYNVNELTQKSALKQLEDISKIKTEIRTIIDSKRYLHKQLLEIKLVQKIYPSDANFLLVKVDNANLRYGQLMERGVVVRNRTKEPMCENTLRITIGTFEENKQLIDVLKQLDR